VSNSGTDGWSASPEYPATGRVKASETPVLPPLPAGMAWIPVKRSHWKGWVIGTAVSCLMALGAVLLLGVLAHTTAGAGSSGAAGGGSTAQSGDTSLNLPQESESDSPQAVVFYMSGSNGIYAKAFMTGNSNYLLHYYESIDGGGYSTGVMQIQAGQVFHTRQVTNVKTPLNASNGTFTAKYDDQEDNGPVSHDTVTYVWNAGASEWRVTTSNSQPAS
jgi:hypothetical protein